MKASVILSKCSRSKDSFGIRIEERNNSWVRTWAFPIDERKAKHEGFDTNTVPLSAATDPDYPGCPYCGSMGFVQCVCGKIGCEGDIRKVGRRENYTCPWCGETCELQTVANINVSGGGY